MKAREAECAAKGSGRMEVKMAIVYATAVPHRKLKVKASTRTVANRLIRERIEHPPLEAFGGDVFMDRAIILFRIGKGQTRAKSTAKAAPVKGRLTMNALPRQYSSQEPR